MRCIVRNPALLCIIYRQSSPIYAHLCAELSEALKSGSWRNWCSFVDFRMCGRIERRSVKASDYGTPYLPLFPLFSAEFIFKIFRAY